MIIYGDMYMNRLIFRAFIITGGLFTLALAGLFTFILPNNSRASNGSVTLKIQVQGSHREADRIQARVIFYKGPDMAFEEENVQFTYRNKAFSTNISLRSEYDFNDRYAIFIKPYKYAGRIFCSSQITGEHCSLPQFVFLTNGSEIDLTKHLFYAGDIPPANGKVDAQDMSLIMRDLGKIASGEAATDVNNDNITDVVDYSLALFSLSAQIKDDEIKLKAAPTPTVAPPTPTASPSATPTVTLTPTVAPSPTLTPIPTATAIPTPTVTPVPPTPTATAIPTPTPSPTPTPLPQLGKNCTNGTAKVTKSINPAWNLNVLRIPYGRSQYTCVNANMIVLHWSDSPTFLGNSATWGTLNTRNIVCGLAIDDKETLQMSNFYDDKVTWEGCSNLQDSINIEINGTQFDLWYDKNCDIVNPATNNALAAGELQKKKEDVARQYNISTRVLDWENPRYVTIMQSQEKKVLDTVRYLLLYYDIPEENVTGHFKLTTSKIDPGPRFLDCIKKKI